MKNLLKRLLLLPSLILINIIFGYGRLLALLSPPLKRLVNDVLINKIDSQKMSVTHNKKTVFEIYTPNYLCKFRGDTFSTKEPETIDWMDRYGGKDCVFFDVGANIGIYSLYYASKHHGKTYSFEPSVFNSKQLAKNISTNKLHDLITIVPNPLSSNSGGATFINGDESEGGSLSAFGVDYGFDGTSIKSDIQYGLMGFTLDTMMELKLFSDDPTLMKIDVDGIEHLILEGAAKTLRSDKLKSILIEVNDNFSTQSKQVINLLLEAGFKLQEKAQSDFLHDSELFGATYNQIWVK